MTLLSFNKDRMTPYLWRRVNREDKATGKALIYLRIEIVGQERAEFSTGIKATEQEWNQAMQRLVVVRGMTKAQVELQRQEQEHLDVLVSNLRMAYRVQLSQGGRPSPADLRELLRGRKKPDVDRTLLGAIKLLGEHMERKGRQAATIRNTANAGKKLEQYLTHLRKPHLQIDQIDRAWVRAYERWCLDRGYSGRTIQAYIAILERAVDMAIDEGRATTNPVTGYTFLSEIPKAEKRHLSKQEVERMMEHRYAHETLRKVARMFVFACYTGLSYSDYIRFAKAPDDFICYEEVEGIRYKGFALVRQKLLYRKEEHWSPFFQEADALLSELPIYERSYVDKKLKAIAHLLGLSLPDLKHKDARSTFAQLKRTQFGLKSAAKLAHHSENMAKKHYSTESAEEIIRELLVLGAKLTHN